MKKISLGLLVFNENQNLEKTIKKAFDDLKKICENFEIWVFDNNSTDDTRNTVKNLMKHHENLKLFCNEINLGYANNFSSAISNMNGEFLFIIDGDGQYDISDIKNAIEIMNKDKSDILFGIRKPRRDPLIRILMSFFLNILSNLILGSKLKDINCGFRGIRYFASKKIIINYKYNFVNPEIYTLCIINNFKITEMKVNHYHREAGISYFNGIFKTTLTSLKMIKYLYKLKKKLKKN